MQALRNNSLGACLQAGMDPDEDDPGPSAPKALPGGGDTVGAVKTDTGIELTAEDQAALFDEDEDDVDLDALEAQVKAS
jgi:hypothetical protein